MKRVGFPRYARAVSTTRAAEPSVIELEVLGASFCLFDAGTDAVLSPFVAHLWASRGRPAFVAERVIPDGGSVLLFNLGAALEVQGEGTQSVMRETFFAGPMSSWADVRYGHDAMHEQVGVLFRPGGAAAYFGAHAEALEDVAGEPSLLPPMRLDPARIGDAMRTTRSLATRIAILAAALRSAVRVDAAPPVTTRIMAMMRRHPTESVKAHAARAGWTQQHLHRVLRRESGMGTKGLQQVVRLQRTLSALERWHAHGSDEEGSLARLAVRHGFVDQSHLTNTVRTMTGLTPQGLRGLPPRALGRVLYVVPR